MCVCACLCVCVCVCARVHVCMCVLAVTSGRFSSVHVSPHLDCYLDNLHVKSIYFHTLSWAGLGVMESDVHLVQCFYVIAQLQGHHDNTYERDEVTQDEDSCLTFPKKEILQEEETLKKCVIIDSISDIYNMVELSLTLIPTSTEHTRVVGG